MPRNQPTKMPWRHQSISRLQNQQKDSPLHSDSTPQPTPPQSHAASPDLSESDEEDEDVEFINHFDSLKPNYEALKNYSDDEEELGNMDELLELSINDLTNSMVELFVKDDDDDGDLDWVPERLCKKAEKEKKTRKGELRSPLIEMA